jgi:UDP-2-acetamido-3-amino-2,3-dideoxy-glucuronate N-acetyltransferase
VIHPTAQVDERARLGDNVRVWSWVQVREDAEIGENTILSKGVYVDSGVRIGRNVKIQNNVSVYAGVTIEDGVFVGPHVCFTNDKHPRAINPNGSLKSADDWVVTPIRVCYGASLGANATIVPGVTIGRFAMVGSGAVVTRDVPDHGLALGNPARVVGYVCSCGERLAPAGADMYRCPKCSFEIRLQAGTA